MSKKTLLSLHGNGVLGLDQLEDDFDIIHLYHQKDPEGFGYDENKINQIISENKESIVAINCTVGQKISENLITRLPNLEIIATFSVGFDHIDIKSAKNHGVAVTNTPDVLTESTADLTMALVLACARRVTEGEKFLRARKYKTWKRITDKMNRINFLQCMTL